MAKPIVLVSKFCLTLALAFGAFILLTLAVVAASLFAPFNLITAFSLGLAAAFLLVGIIRTWQRPDGWRFALVAAAVGVSLWAYLAYGPSYVSPSTGSHVVIAP